MPLRKRLQKLGGSVAVVLPKSVAEMAELHPGDAVSISLEGGAVVIRSVASASLRSPHTGSLRYDAKQPKIPAAALSVEDAMLVHRLLERGERVRMHLLLTPRELPDVASSNVVADLLQGGPPRDFDSADLADLSTIRASG